MSWREYVRRSVKFCFYVDEVELARYLYRRLRRMGYDVDFYEVLSEVRIYESV